MSFWDGLSHCMSVRNVTKRFQDWESTWLWQGAYFSFGAWGSLYMATGPRIHIKSKGEDEDRAGSIKTGSVRSSASMRTEVLRRFRNEEFFVKLMAGTTIAVSAMYLKYNLGGYHAFLKYFLSLLA